MAKLLVAGSHAFPGALGVYLSDALPDDWQVIADAVVQRAALDAIVVSPGGLVIVQEAPAARPQDGVKPIAALSSFLADDFPSLRPKILLFSAARPEPGALGWAVMEPAGMKDQNLVDAMVAAQGEADPGLADEEVRDALAVALRDRQISARQRTSQPFVFRTAGPLGNASKAWTIRDAVLYMDRHPADGIYHLRNGTLAAWLAAEGADHLASLARAVARQSGGERQALETFLIGSGFLPRPRLVVRPRVVDLGYVLAGESGERVVRLQAGRGRGYLFGTIAPGEPWLSVEPRAFAGRSTDLTVHADTGALSIGAEPHAAELRAECSSSATPVSIPVRLRVSAMPSPLGRVLLRPLAAAVLAGVLGAAAGLALGRWAALVLPAGDGLLADAAFWPMLVGICWALLGVLRGLRQPTAWPIGYAALRWLAWLLITAVLLPALVLLAVWLWNRSGLAGGARFSPADQLTVMLLSIACAAIPATLVELLAYRGQQRQGSGVVLRRRWRLVLVCGLGALLVAGLLASAPSIRPAWQQTVNQGAVTTARARGETAWSRLDAAVGSLLDRLYINYYDRRAPEQAAPTTPEPATTMPDAGTP